MMKNRETGAVRRKSYATVTDEEGVNYRDIADTLTTMGYPMNHSSVRNHVLRIMRKFAQELSDGWSLELSDTQVDAVSRSSSFQRGIADILHTVEHVRRQESSQTI